MSKPPAPYADVRPFVDWIDQHNLHTSNDYDLIGAFNAGVQPDERGHLPDTYKLPNHITYSTESIASEQPGAPPPGRWIGNDEHGYEFHASPTNIKNAGGLRNLQEYFKTHEPDVKLVLPNGK